MATSDFPDPVGVASTTLAPLTSSISASSWCGYSSVPAAAAQAANSVNRVSASAPSGGDSTVGVALMRVSTIPEAS